jgi:hypothetical protein
VPASKKILILDDDGKKIGERFEVTDRFVESLSRNYVETEGPDGQVIRVNKKLNRNLPEGKAAASKQMNEAAKKE